MYGVFGGDLLRDILQTQSRAHMGLGFSDSVTQELAKKAQSEPYPY